MNDGNSRAIAQFVAGNASRTPPDEVLDAARKCLEIGRAHV